MARYVVISGGGAHGAFAVGVIKALRDNDIRFDGVVGTSTGALIAPLVATDEMDLLQELYTTVRTRDILRWWPWNLWTRHAWYSTTPLKKLISRQITAERYERILAASIEVWLATVALQNGVVTYWNPHISGPNGGAMSRDTFQAAMLASASQPVLMPVVPLSDRAQHVDGGVREIAPLKQAIDQGATEIYAIVLSPADRQSPPQPYRAVVPILLRTLDLLLAEIVANDLGHASLYNKALTYVDQLRDHAARYLDQETVEKMFDTVPSPFAGKRHLTLHLLRPDEELPGDSLSFEPGMMRAMLSRGEQVARRYLEGEATAPPRV